MTRTLCILLTLLTMAVVAQSASAEMVATPDFIDYEIREKSHPHVASVMYEYWDLMALFVGLVLSSLFAIDLRSRRGLFLLAVVSLAWLGFWRAGCVCPIGAIQNVTLALADPDYAIPMTTVVIFALPLLFTLLFGRTFCGAVCPLGAIQELVARRPIRVPLWLEQALGLLAYVYLGAAVALAATGSAFLICRYDPFVAFFRLGGSVNMLIFGGCFLLIGVFVGRPYCRFLCPYGALLGICSRVSQWHLKIPPNECIQCRLCEDVCPYGAIREPTTDQRPEVMKHARWRLGMLIVLLPVLIGLGVMAGGALRVPFSQMHPTVRLAERVLLEEEMQEEVDRLVEKEPVTEDDAWRVVLIRYGKLEQKTDASQAFEDEGTKTKDLVEEAVDVTRRTGIATRWFGAWVGLIIGLKLIHLAVRRRRTDYQPDRTGCVSCGRCFWYCPNEQAKQ